MSIWFKGAVEINCLALLNRFFKYLQYFQYLAASIKSGERFQALLPAVSPLKQFGYLCVVTRVVPGVVNAEQDNPGERGGMKPFPFMCLRAGRAAK